MRNAHASGADHKTLADGDMKQEHSYVVVDTGYGDFEQVYRDNL